MATTNEERKRYVKEYIRSLAAILAQMKLRLLLRHTVFLRAILILMK